MATTFELYLMHGRSNPDADMSDWGTNGPRLQGVKGLHQTYGNGARVVFVDADCAKAAEARTGWTRWDDCNLEMTWHEDLVKATCNGETIAEGHIIPGLQIMPICGTVRKAK